MVVTNYLLSGMILQVTYPHLEGYVWVDNFWPGFPLRWDMYDRFLEDDLLQGSFREAIIHEPITTLR